MQPGRIGSLRSTHTAGKRPARRRMFARMPGELGAVCSTTKIDAGKSAGNSAAIDRSASMPRRGADHNESGFI